MKVRDIMTSKVMTVKPDDTVSFVASLLIQHRFNGLPVVDKDGILLGLIAERDFISSESKIYLPTYIKMLQDFDYVKGDRRQLPEDVKKVINATAADVMNTNVVTTTADTDLSDLTEVFAKQRVNPVPVIDQGHKLIGIIARSDLIRLFALHHIKA